MCQVENKIKRSQDYKRFTTMRIIHNQRNSQPKVAKIGHVDKSSRKEFLPLKWTFQLKATTS